MKKTAAVVLVSLLLFLFTSFIPAGQYLPEQVLIGTDTWMTHNLDVAEYRNGDPIPEAKSAADWDGYAQKKTGCWCYYNNDTANRAKHGKLYNWYAVNDVRGLAPRGWRVPAVEDWNNLLKAIGGKKNTIQLFRSKEKGVGFNGHYSGGRGVNGVFIYQGAYAYWWTTTRRNAGSGFAMMSYQGGLPMKKWNLKKETGASVRCLAE